MGFEMSSSKSGSRLGHVAGLCAPQGLVGVTFHDRPASQGCQAAPSGGRRRSAGTQIEHSQVPKKAASTPEAIAWHPRCPLLSASMAIFHSGLRMGPLTQVRMGPLTQEGRTMITRFWHKKRTALGTQRGFTLIELMIVVAVNGLNQSAGPFMASVPAPPPGGTPAWGAYGYASSTSGTFSITATGDGTTITVP